MITGGLNCKVDIAATRINYEGFRLREKVHCVYLSPSRVKPPRIIQVAHPNNVQ